MSPADPWTEFAAAADGAEACGYFERAGDAPGGARAYEFLRAGELVTLGPSSDLRATRSRLDRFLSEHPRGGALGYLGFDAFGLFEPALRSFPAGSPFPLGELALVPRLRELPVRRRDRSPLVPARIPRPASDTLPGPRFERGVRRLTGAIRAGEAFQVVLAHRRTWRRPSDLLARAARLRAAERFSSFYYLRFGDREVLGASPESVAELSGRRAWVDPIAGTIPHGSRRGRRPLARDPKELCEHRMLVDLARNDLGKVAAPGAVRLEWTERLVRYARLDHLVSRVGADLRNGAGPWEVLGATFPAGTVSGAPKIRATELLRREEGTWRGPYGGAVMLLRPHRRASFSLAIRTAFAAGGRLYTAAGAGIVHRSRPAREHAETLTKLATLETALLGEAG